MKPIFVVMFQAHESEPLQLVEEHGYFPYEQERQAQDLVNESNLRIKRTNYVLKELQKKVIIVS